MRKCHAPVDAYAAPRPDSVTWADAAAAWARLARDQTPTRAAGRGGRITRRVFADVYPSPQHAITTSTHQTPLFTERRVQRQVGPMAVHSQSLNPSTFPQNCTRPTATARRPALICIICPSAPSAAVSLPQHSQCPNAPGRSPTRAATAMLPPRPCLPRLANGPRSLRRTCPRRPSPARSRRVLRAGSRR